MRARMRAWMPAAATCAAVAVFVLELVARGADVARLAALP